MIEPILPHLQAFLEARITPDGNSGRSVVIPPDWPDVLSPSSLPQFVNQITGVTLAGQNSLYWVFNVTVTVRLYYKPIGQDIKIKHQYDLYHYASAFLQALVDQPRLRVDGIGDMPAIEKAVSLGATRIPDKIPYPPDDPQGLQYTGATFNIIVPIQVVRC